MNVTKKRNKETYEAAMLNKRMNVTKKRNKETHETSYVYQKYERNKET